jgi:Reverse transcriptase (RNA-dependent DNA polymerase)
VFTNCVDDIDFQFGFKNGNSTDICTHTFKSTVDYYRRRGSHVFVCFIDYTKAFDSVNYWKLFLKLIDYNIPHCLVSLLAFWYSNQSVCIKWKCELSAKFGIGNGTRQGSLLSPFLFNVYIADLLRHINNSGIGCNVGGKMINVLAYADDLVLLAPTWAGLQSLLHILDSYSVCLDMSINIKKTVCMIYKPICRNKILNCEFPKFQLHNYALLFVNSFRYLGHIIENCASDNDDIEREIRNLFIRTNVLIRRFHYCSQSVKVLLFKSFCLCFYGLSVWKSFSAKCIGRFEAAYHKCIKNFFRFARRDSVTCILAD